MQQNKDLVFLTLCWCLSVGYMSRESAMIKSDAFFQMHSIPILYHASEGTRRLFNPYAGQCTLRSLIQPGI